MTSRDLVAAYVDHVRDELGLTPPARVRGMVARQVKTLLDEGVPPEVLRQALLRMADSGVSPRDLPIVVMQVAAKDGYKETNEYIVKHGWPTGIRMVRGEHGINWIEDPLGVDPPPPFHRASRPTRREIRQALNARKRKEGKHGQTASVDVQPASPDEAQPRSPAGLPDVRSAQ